MLSSEDIFMWPDGSWCYRHEQYEMTWRSDDYRIIPIMSEQWLELVGDCHGA